MIQAWRIFWHCLLRFHHRGYYDGTHFCQDCYRFKYPYSLCEGTPWEVEANAWYGNLEKKT